MRACFHRLLALTVSWSSLSSTAPVFLSEAEMLSPGDMTSRAPGMQFGNNHLRSADGDDPRRMKPPVSLKEIRSMSGSSAKGGGVANNIPASVIGGGNSQPTDSKRAGQLKSVKSEMSSMFKSSSYARRATDDTDAIISMELSPVEGDPERELEDMTGSPDADSDGSVEGRAPAPPPNIQDPAFQSQLSQLSQLASMASNPTGMASLQQQQMFQQQQPQQQFQQPQWQPPILPPMQLDQQQQYPQMPQQQQQYPQQQQQQFPQQQQQQYPQQQQQQQYPQPQQFSPQQQQYPPPQQYPQQQQQQQQFPQQQQQYPQQQPPVQQMQQPPTQPLQQPASNMISNQPIVENTMPMPQQMGQVQQQPPIQQPQQAQVAKL